jgi:micrococcal nuclease
MLLALTVLLAGCAGSSAIPVESIAPTLPATAETVTVRSVRDGDSLQVARADGSVAEVRLIGINAPERDECGGAAATAALEAMLQSEPVAIDAVAEDRDQYGRLLRFVYAAGENLNLALVAAGHAVVVQTGSSLQEELIRQEDEAIEAGRGLWAADACGDEPPAPIVIDGYVTDPPGADDADLNAEWVAVANRGDEPVDLDGWVLRDESTVNRFRFAATTVLDHGAVLRVHSGCGSDTATDVYWCSEIPVWSNGGDTIILQSPSGTVIAVLRYSE